MMQKYSAGEDLYRICEQGLGKRVDGNPELYLVSEVVEHIAALKAENKRLRDVLESIAEHITGESGDGDDMKRDAQAAIGTVSDGDAVLASENAQRAIDIQKAAIGKEEGK